MSQGASIEWANYSFKGHALRLGAHYKIDEHTDAASAKDPSKHYRDVTRSLVVEDTISLAERWSLNLALSHDQRNAREAYQWPTGSASATNGVAKLGYALGGGSEAYFIASHKTRFPTIKDRYSARMGGPGHPDLQPETANHLELGVSGSPWQGGQGQAALFYSRVRNQIQTVVLASAECGGTTCNQAQNVGRTRNIGMELSLAQQLSAQWGVNAGYTYLNRRNTSDSSITLTHATPPPAGRRSVASAGAVGIQCRGRDREGPLRSGVGQRPAADAQAARLRHCQPARTLQAAQHHRGLWRGQYRRQVAPVR